MSNARTNPNANIVTGTFLLNNCYASMLFDTGANRSFVSTAFSSHFDITPTVLDHDNTVELANGRIVGVNTKMAPKRTTRSTPATTTTTTTTSVTDALLKILIDQCIANALAARDADRSQNGKDSHDSRMGVRRQAPPARECTYQDFMK
nr:reverse transcriptase domain-containing protein [Tanacetum cinerariifolium]